MEVNAAIVSTNHQKYSYSEYVKDLKQLKKKYPEYCHVNVVGRSADKRNIYEVVLGKPNAQKHLVVIANLHAREYMTTQLCMKQIERYISCYNKTIGGKVVGEVLNDVAIHYLPSCNPDGTAISQYGFHAICNKKLRKALKKMSGKAKTWKANARGVDLNRNWDMVFQKAGEKGSFGYRGEKPESEPEVKAILKAVNAIEENGKVKGIISYHSTGSVIFGKCLQCADENVKENTTAMYKLAQKLTKYEIMPMEQLEDTSGCSREYFLYKRNIPFITIEVGKKACPLKIKEFKFIWKKNKDLVIKEAALFYTEADREEKL